MPFSSSIDSTPCAFVPPDVNYPPSSIPLKTIENRYIILRALGHGSFGTVTLAKSQFDLRCLSKSGEGVYSLMYQDQAHPQNKITNCQKLVAIKTMITRVKTLQEYKRVREVKFILKMPPSPHLIQIFEVFVDNRNYQLHIVMEYMEQNLYQMMKHRKNRIFSYPSLRSILGQLLAAIRHIHAYNFFHRDIKPENILVTPSSLYFDKEYINKTAFTDNYVIKLADFGLARDIFNSKSYTPYVSTRWYRSPEILLRNGFYSTPLDIWAFGCVAFELTTFKPLFPGNDELDQVWKILEILGTPYKSPEFTGLKSAPYGGYWKDSLALLNKLNLKLPFAEGISMATILPNPQLKDLTDVLGECLKWDPRERVSASELTHFQFFDGTVAQNENTYKETEITNMQQAMMFAGLKTDPTFTVNKNIRIDGENEDHNKKDVNKDCIKRKVCPYPPQQLNPNSGNRIIEDFNKSTSRKSLQDKITVNEFLQDYKRDDFAKYKNDIKKDKDILFPTYETEAYYLAANQPHSLKKDEFEYEDIDIDLEEVLGGDEDGQEEGKDDILSSGECDTDDELIEKELSSEIERNLKNYSIPREVPEDYKLTSAKVFGNQIESDPLFNQENFLNQKIGTLDLNIHSDMFQDFSSGFETNRVEKEDVKETEHTYKAKYNDKSTNSYTLSDKIRVEIQPKHNNLLDTSFESSLNFTPRKYLPEHLIPENYFSINSDDVIANLQTSPDRSQKERIESDLFGNITF